MLVQLRLCLDVFAFVSRLGMVGDGYRNAVLGVIKCARVEKAALQAQWTRSIYTGYVSFAKLMRSDTLYKYFQARSDEAASLADRILSGRIQYS